MYTHYPGAARSVELFTGVIAHAYFTLIELYYANDIHATLILNNSTRSQWSKERGHVTRTMDASLSGSEEEKDMISGANGLQKRCGEVVNVGNKRREK